MEFLIDLKVEAGEDAHDRLPREVEAGGEGGDLERKRTEVPMESGEKWPLTEVNLVPPTVTLRRRVFNGGSRTGEATS